MGNGGHATELLVGMRKKTKTRFAKIPLGFGVF
jgi:hypothetical protein